MKSHILSDLKNPYRGLLKGLGTDQAVIGMNMILAFLTGLAAWGRFEKAYITVKA